MDNRYVACTIGYREDEEPILMLGIRGPGREVMGDYQCDQIWRFLKNQG